MASLSLSLLLSQAQAELSNLKPEETFLVKDLFKGYEWARISLNDRRNLGSLFLSVIKSNPKLGVQVLNKTTSNQQKYKKK